MEGKVSGRLPLIDALRGFAIINVVIYHFLYDIYVVYDVMPAWPDLPAIDVWQRLGCSLFLLLAGMALHLGRHALRRGLQLNLLGLVITAATCLLLPEEAIYYGILTFFGCAMWLGLLLRPLLQKISPVWGLVLCALGYVLTQDVSSGWVQLGERRLYQWPQVLYDDRLALLGFHGSDFASADYVPLLPHIFVFIGGWFLYAWLARTNRLGCLACGEIKLLTLPGRHSLLIYLAHQPLLMAVSRVVFGY